ncbi:MAG: hypothetical protein ACOX0Z_01485 [Candidatus Nanosyncoccaceae bacterium]|jgi:hypothetical protein
MLNSILSTFAVCPLCTVAVGAGLAISQKLGIDDTVTSVWIGGLLMSVSIWTINWLTKKKWTFPGYQIVVGLVWYALVFVPLYLNKTLFIPNNEILGIDKIIFGTIIGSLVFAGAADLYKYLKKKNDNKAHFPFEKVVIPFVGLLITSLIFYFLTIK